METASIESLPNRTIRHFGGAEIYLPPNFTVLDDGANDRVFLRVRFSFPETSSTIDRIVYHAATGCGRAIRRRHKYEYVDLGFPLFDGSLWQRDFLHCERRSTDRTIRSSRSKSDRFIFSITKSLLKHPVQSDLQLAFCQPQSKQRSARCTSLRHPSSQSYTRLLADLSIRYRPTDHCLPSSDRWLDTSLSTQSVLLFLSHLWRLS